MCIGGGGSSHLIRSLTKPVLQPREVIYQNGCGLSRAGCFLLFSSLVIEKGPFLVTPEGKGREGDTNGSRKPWPFWGVGTQAERGRGGPA